MTKFYKRYLIICVCILKIRYCPNGEFISPSIIFPKLFTTKYQYNKDQKNG